VLIPQVPEQFVEVLVCAPRIRGARNAPGIVVGLVPAK